MCAPQEEHATTTACHGHCLWALPPSSTMSLVAAITTPLNCCCHCSLQSPPIRCRPPTINLIVIIILVCVVIDTTLLSTASPVTSVERTMFAIPKAFVTDSYPIPLYGQLCGGWGGLGGLCQEKHIPLSGMDLNLSDCCGEKKICSKIQDSYTMLVIKVLSHNPCNSSSLYPPSESDWTYL